VDHQRELIPVPASVFDDDFFRGAAAQEALEAQEMANEVQESDRESAHFVGQNFVQREERLSTMKEPLVAEAAVRTASFAGAVAASTDPGEPDELDIPAFLRRGK
jgi:cell division protein FtsZ